MQFRAVPLALALAAALPGAALAQTDATPAKPDFSSMMGFVGSWSCKTTKSPDPKRIGRIEKVTIALDPGGSWMTQTTAHEAGLLTYDPKQKLWIFMGVGSDGYGLSTSPGWTGNTLVVTDKVSSDPLGTDTYTKTSDTTFDETYIIPGPPALTFGDTCTKMQ